MQDDDNDSWPERAALVSFNLVEVAHAEGLFGTGTPRLSSINLGDVTLEGTVSLRGVVVDAEGAPAPGAKVIVARSISTVDLNGRPLLTSGSVEAQVATDDEGRFELAAIIPGTFSVVAMRTTEDGLRVSETKELTTNGATALTLLGEDALQLSAAAPASREVVAKLSPPPAAGVNVILRVTPADRGLVQFEVVGDGGDYSDGERSLGERAVGQYNVVVETSDGQRSAPERHLVLPGTGPIRWGTISLISGLCQAGEDCDGDGVRGIPRNLLQACSASCITGAATCVLDGETYDCEDDGDGQIDSTEPQCYGVGSGTDCDGDGICDWEDDDPFCRPDDVNCDPTFVRNNCGRLAPTPPVDGGPIDGGPIDGGVDGGPVDGGVDGGPVDGGVDGGPTDGGVDSGFPVDASLPIDGGVDAGPVDGGVDSGTPVDAGGPIDGGVDAGPVDAGPVDAGPVDAGPVDAGPPPLDHGFGRVLGSLEPEWTNAENAVPFGAGTMVHLSRFSPQLVEGIVGCPNGETVENRQIAFAVFDASGECVMDHYLAGPSSGNGLLDSVALHESSTGAVALVKFSGTLEYLPGVVLSASPAQATNLVFLEYALDGGVTVLAQHEYIDPFGPSSINGGPIFARDSAGMTTLHVPVFGGSSVTIDTEVLAASSTFNTSHFLVAFDATGEVLGSRELAPGPDDGYFEPISLTAGVAGTVTFTIRTFDQETFIEEPFTIPSRSYGLISVDMLNAAATPEATVFEGTKSLCAADHDSGMAFVALGPDSAARMLQVDSAGNIYLSSVFDPYSSPVANVNAAGGTRIASNVDASLVVVAYQTALGGARLERISLDDGAAVGIANTGTVNALVFDDVAQEAIYLSQSSIRSVAADGGLATPVNHLAVQAQSDLAISPDHAFIYFSQNRGPSGFSVDRLPVASLQGGSTPAPTPLFEIATTAAPRLAVDEDNDSLWIFTDSGLYRYSLATGGVPVQLFDPGIGAPLPPDMDVSLRDGVVILSATSGNNGPLVYTFDGEVAASGFNSTLGVQRVESRPVVVSTPNDTHVYAPDSALIVLELGTQGNVVRQAPVGTGGGMVVEHIHATPTTLQLVGRNDSGEDGGAAPAPMNVVTTAGTAIELFRPQDHPSRVSSAVAVSLVLNRAGAGTFGDVERAVQSNALGTGRGLRASPGVSDNDVVVLGSQYLEGAAPTTSPIFLGTHVLDVESSFSPRHFLWRLGVDEMAPRDGDPEIVQGLSFTSSFAPRESFVVANRTRGERLIAVWAQSGTLGAVQGCTSASTTTEGILFAVLDEDGQCLRSGNLSFTGANPAFDVRPPLLAEDGTAYFSVATSQVVVAQTNGPLSQTAISPTGGSVHSAIVAVTSSGGVSTAAEVSSVSSVLAGHLERVDAKSHLWVVPYSGQGLLLGANTATFGNAATTDKFVVIEVDAQTGAQLMWDALQVADSTTTIEVDDVLVRPNGSYALALGGDGRVFGTTVGNGTRIVAQCSPQPPGSVDGYRVDVFDSTT